MTGKDILDTSEVVANCVELVAVKMREEWVTEREKILSEVVSIFHKEIEESKVDIRKLKLKMASIEADSLNAHLQSSFPGTGSDTVQCLQQLSKLASAMKILQEEHREEQFKTKACISELVCGIESVANEFAAKNSRWEKRVDDLELQMLKKPELQMHKKPALNPDAASAGNRILSSAAWPLLTVKESDVVPDQEAKIASFEQELAKEMVSMRMQLEYLHGDVSELRKQSSESNDQSDTTGHSPTQVTFEERVHANGNAVVECSLPDAVSSSANGLAELPQPEMVDESEAYPVQLHEELERQERHRAAIDSGGPSDGPSVARLSCEMKETKVEVAEALGIVHEAVRLGAVLRQVIENDRQERNLDMRKLHTRLDHVEKASYFCAQTPRAVALQTPRSGTMQISPRILGPTVKELPRAANSQPTS